MGLAEEEDSLFSSAPLICLHDGDRKKPQGYRFSITIFSSLRYSGLGRSFAYFPMNSSILFILPDFLFPTCSIFRLSEWDDFDEKYRCLCEWLNEMESKISQAVELPLEGVMDQLEKVLCILDLDLDLDVCHYCFVV